MEGDREDSRSSRRAVFIVLFDDDAKASDGAKGDARVGNVRDGAGGIKDGLDAYAVLALGDGAVRDGDALDRVVVAPAHRANAEPVSATAETAREYNVGAGVDRETVVLVEYGCARDRHRVAAAHVEGVRVVSAW